jgi:hypothetical protein
VSWLNRRSVRRGWVDAWAGPLQAIGVPGVRARGATIVGSMGPLDMEVLVVDGRSANPHAGRALGGEDEGPPTLLAVRLAWAAFARRHNRSTQALKTLMHELARALLPYDHARPHPRARRSRGPWVPSATPRFLVQPVDVFLELVPVDSPELLIRESWAHRALGKQRLVERLSEGPRIAREPVSDRVPEGPVVLRLGLAYP